MKELSYAVILGNLGNTCDRFLSSGYKEQPPKSEMFRLAASIKGVKGVELVGSWDITSKNVSEIKQELENSGLKCVAIIPDLFAKKLWGKGTFTSKNPEVRKQAISETKEMMDVALDIGCDMINLWPGQDGYDYCFQGDFEISRNFMIESIRECAKYRPEIKISLEYKAKEPRTHSYLARAADTLLVALAANCENVGVTIDVGHSFLGGENVAESASLLMSHNKLFHMHFNDNYRSWDDDMIVGSVHMPEYIELIYWLNKMGYSGWYSMDQYPYREDARDSLNESIRWIEGLWIKMNKLGIKHFDKAVDSGNAVEISKLLREVLNIQN